MTCKFFFPATAFFFAMALPAMAAAFTLDDVQRAHDANPLAAPVDHFDRTTFATAAKRSAQVFDAADFRQESPWRSIPHQELRPTGGGYEQRSIAYDHHLHCAGGAGVSRTARAVAESQNWSDAGQFWVGVLTSAAVGVAIEAVQTQMPERTVSATDAAYTAGCGALEAAAGYLSSQSETLDAWVTARASENNNNPMMPADIQVSMGVKLRF